MTSSTFTALVPVAVAKDTETASSGCSGHRRLASRTKWLILAAVGLALAGLAVGSAWLGAAALLPLLYTLPCLLMVAMCLRGMSRNGSSGGTSQ